MAKTHFTESNFEWYSRIEKCFEYLKSPNYQIYVHAGLIYKSRKSGYFLSRHMRAIWAFSTRNFKLGWLAVISCKLLTLYMKIILEACYVWCGVKQNCIFVCVPVIYQFLNILHSQFFFYQTTFHIAKPTKKCTTSPLSGSYHSLPLSFVYIGAKKIRLSNVSTGQSDAIEDWVSRGRAHTHTYTHAAAGRGWTSDAPELETRARGVGFGRCLSSCQLLFQSLACHWWLRVD